MSEEKPETVHEIVIVRRRSDGDHDDHHGGVWKVAFADFMTAMMAFFLVLWIVNSTTKQTRSSLARYFNPIRLSDTTPARKGLNDPREVDFDASSEEHGRVEARVEKQAALSESSAGSAGSADARGSKEPAAKGGEQHRAAGLEKLQGQFVDPFVARRQTAPMARSKESTGADQTRSSRNNEAKDLKAAVEAKIGEKLAGSLNGAFRVEASSDGLLISLTDRTDMGAFAVGSSDAEEKLNTVLSGIASVLRDRPGAIIVRGHTDSRPYRPGGNDNWQLSFARAQTGFAGLVRGGLEERRIERVEAYADRKLKNLMTPDAAENRRIEILLREPVPR